MKGNPAKQRWQDLGRGQQFQWREKTAATKGSTEQGRLAPVFLFLVSHWLCFDSMLDFRLSETTQLKQGLT